MLQSGSDYCPACNSFFHAPDTCPKTLPTYQPVSNTLIGPVANTWASDGLALELHLRSILAYGIGHEGRRCDMHRKMHSQMLGHKPTDRFAHLPIVLDYFDDSCVVTRSLLPICSTCVQTETGLEKGALVSGLDMCQCATMLARAPCPNCMLGEINGAFKYDVLRGRSQVRMAPARLHAGVGTRLVPTRLQDSVSIVVGSRPPHSMDMAVRFWSLRVVLCLRYGGMEERESRRTPIEQCRQFAVEVTALYLILSAVGAINNVSIHIVGII